MLFGQYCAIIRNSSINRSFKQLNYINKNNQLYSVTQLMKSYSSLPKRNTQQQQVNPYRKIVIDSNRYKVDISKVGNISIYAIKIINQKINQTPEEKLNIVQKVLPQIRKFISNPIIKDGLIYSLNPQQQRDKDIKFGNYIIVIREIYRFNAVQKPEMVTFFLSNIIRKVMEKLGYIEVGQSKKFINMDKKFQVQNLFVYSGFKVNFQLLDNCCFLTVDTSKKIVRNQTVLQYIQMLYKTNEHLQREEKRALVCRNLIKQIVMTNYGKTRYLRVEDVCFVDLTQVIVESCKMFLPQYYLFRYKYKIEHPKQPLLIAKKKKSKYKTYLIPQLCLMTGIPETFTEGNNRMITESAKVSTGDRKNQIDDFIKSMKQNQEDLIFPSLGITISNQSTQIQGKILPAPKIQLGGGKTIKKGCQSSFSTHDMPPYKATQPTKIAIIVYDGVDSSQIVEYFMSTFKNFKIKIGITTIKVDEKNSKRVDTLNFFIQLAKDKQNCNFCLIILPNKMRESYQRIKEESLLKKQMNCQVVLESTLKKKNILSIAEKILSQILAKSGDKMWAVIPQINKSQVMQVAYYSTQVGKAKSNSFCVGICASCDDLQTRIFSKSKAFTKQYEQYQAMKQLLLESLSVYKKKNGCLPEDIVILQNVKPPKTEASTKQYFINPTIAFMQEFYGSKRPKIVYIVISKSTSDRFFRQYSQGFVNPPIGTLIDSTVTGSKDQFYLIAHNICRSGGSIMPLKYKIVYSDSNMDPMIIKTMLFSQCFNYMNFQGAIKQPALLQNAIKCAKFGAEVLLNVEIPDNLKLYPYYL